MRRTFHDLVASEEIERAPLVEFREAGGREGATGTQGLDGEECLVQSMEGNIGIDLGKQECSFRSHATELVPRREIDRKAVGLVG